MHRSNQARLGPVLLFSVCYMVAIGVMSRAAETPGLGMYLGLIAVLGVAIYRADRAYPFPPALLWAFSIWGLFHMIGGLVPLPSGWPAEGSDPVFYNWWLIPESLKYDQLVHAYGFGLTTYFCWHVLRTALRSPDGSPVRPTLAMMVLCVAGGMGFGALNEVVEFIATFLLPENNVGDYNNLGWDLVANLAGSLIAALAIRGLYGRRQGIR